MIFEMDPKNDSGTTRYKTQTRFAHEKITLSYQSQSKTELRHEGKTCLI